VVTGSVSVVIWGSDVQPLTPTMIEAAMAIKVRCRTSRMDEMQMMVHKVTSLLAEIKVHQE
jgi:hypothetical protein